MIAAALASLIHCTNIIKVNTSWESLTLTKMDEIPNGLGAFEPPERKGKLKYNFLDRK